jgi:hypothetical protein
MTGALARIDARHLARSPLLWLGTLLAAGFAALELRMYWPALAGDDAVASRGSYLLSGGVLLAGAWLALRDRASATADLVAVTPTTPWRLWRARLLAVAVAAVAAFTLLFTAVLAVSTARGGRGTPDLRLLADGALAVVLGGWIGLALGRLTGSRVVPLLAAPVWVAASLYLANDTRLHELPLSMQRLSPLLGWEQRSAAFGFLPDALWPHLGYLLGLVLLIGLAVLLGGRRADGPRLPARPALAAGLVGLVLAVGGGLRLVTLPDLLVVLGPDRADWRPVELHDAHHDPAVDAMYSDRDWSFPEDGRATACTRDATLAACVYPAYGEGMAGYLHRVVAPVATLFRGLPGAPDRLRMVPTDGIGSCRGAEVQVPEQLARASGNGFGERANRFLFADLYLRCAVGAPEYLDHDPTDDADDARNAVKLWALLASGTMTREELSRQPGTGLGSLLITFTPGPVAPVALRMADLSPDQVRRELAPVWDRLRAGELAVSELPGQRP